MKKIAIIGTGISGMSAAYSLKPYANITLYEKNTVLGGHSRTVTAFDGKNHIPVDTGFIVFNHRNYPLLTRLFDHLNVPTAPSNMSFGVSINKGWLEYSTMTLGGIFAQKRNLLRPFFWKMIFDIIKVNRLGKNYLDDKTKTLQQALGELRASQAYQDYFLGAMGASIWSTPLKKMYDFPAASFMRFFENHGLLSLTDQPQWRTVLGGSREYVKRLTADLLPYTRLDCGVQMVKRLPDGGVQVMDMQGNHAVYDDVIFACHSDQALKIIDNPTSQEQAILGNIHYGRNKMVLHSDVRFMPKRKKAWASWVYLSDEQSGHEKHISLSYWMNNLQPLQTELPLFVTLNPATDIPEHLVHDSYDFEHPVFDHAAINAAEKIDDIQGKNHLWFCGAYQRYGFHEDGLWSSVRMLEKMGYKPQWL